MDLFKKKFCCNTYLNISDAVKNEKIDIVVVSTPTETHESIFNEIIKSNKKYFYILEKPLASTYNKSNLILQKCKKNKINMTVNYFREFIPEYKKTAYKIKNGLLGFPLRGTLFYNRGIFNNGSHFIAYSLNFFVKTAFSSLLLLL